MDGYLNNWGMGDDVYHFTDFPIIEYAPPGTCQIGMVWNGLQCVPVTHPSLPASPVASSGLSSGWIIAIAIGALFLFSKR